MIIHASQAFEQMDIFSLQREPFIFAVDYAQKYAFVLRIKDLHQHDIEVDFPYFSFKKNRKVFFKDFHLSSFPETQEDYARGFYHIQKHLQAGDTYLANYTCKTPIKTNYSLAEIFASTQAKYKMRYQDHFVFFSPETFVEIKKNHISTYPMKGTIDASVENAEYELRNNIKEKAEHYTVVDLLRNDLSIVAQGVYVKEFQRIDRIKTHRGELLGMSSEIVGIIRPDFENKIGTILQNLLPAGSILGAPKLETARIVAEAEKEERGWYTGVCGYFDGENLDSCVMIRFIEQKGNQLYFRSGGGITHQSKIEDEYEEMKNKIYVPILRKH